MTKSFYRIVEKKVIPQYSSIHANDHTNHVNHTQDAKWQNCALNIPQRDKCEHEHETFDNSSSKLNFGINHCYYYLYFQNGHFGGLNKIL